MALINTVIVVPNKARFTVSEWRKRVTVLEAQLPAKTTIHLIIIPGSIQTPIRGKKKKIFIDVSAANTMNQSPTIAIMMKDQDKIELALYRTRFSFASSLPCPPKTLFKLAFYQKDGLIFGPPFLLSVSPTNTGETLTILPVPLTIP